MANSYYFGTGRRRHKVRGRAGRLVTFYCGMGGYIDSPKLVASQVEPNCGLCLRAAGPQSKKEEGEMTDLTLTSKYLNALSIRAEREPIGTDISDFSDEFCEGFLAGQVNAIEHLLRERTELTSGQVIEKPTTAGAEIGGR